MASLSAPESELAEEMFNCVMHLVFPVLTLLGLRDALICAEGTDGPELLLSMF